jgi:hypothetical protein|tara:strand:+ start:1490 stop:1681 length:192 start_codon:yes stop_codon:yes gene_type:complete
MINDNFTYFAKFMYMESCLERKAWGEKQITYLEYLENNLEFIYNEFQKQNPNKRRKGMDERNS